MQTRQESAVGGAILRERTDEPLIRVRDLSIALGEFSVYEASMEVDRGDYFVLLGPTGAGKTVLLECIAGLHRPDSGDIHVGGLRINEMPPEQRGLGYLPQDYALFPHLDVARNIGFGMRLRRKPRFEIAKTVQSLAKMLGITHLLHRTPIHLSGGERQRVALARALAIEPKVLLLDEPLSALDEQTREGLCVELRRVHEELGTTTVHVSHNFEETLAVADKIGIIHHGRIQQIGTPEEIFRRPVSEFVARFVRCENVLQGAARRDERGLRVRVAQTDFLFADGPEGDVLLTIRPEEIEVTAEALTDRPNLVRGRVTRIIDKGALIRVDIDAGFKLTALKGRKDFQSENIDIGDEVSAYFEPESAHILQGNS